MECELLRSPMISYRSLLYNTIVLYEYIYGDSISLQSGSDQMGVVNVYFG